MEERNIFAQKKAPFKCPEIVTLLRKEDFPALEAELAKGLNLPKDGISTKKSAYTNVILKHLLTLPCPVAKRNY